MEKSTLQNAIEVTGLCKTYAGSKKFPPKEVLIDINLAIPRGSFFGLLGPNGAGKSTLINILAGLVVRSGGDARVWGYHVERDMRSARRAIGVVPQELNLDPFFTPREALDLQAGLFGVPLRERRTDAILEAVGLTPQADSYSRILSGGMRRRLLVAKALVHSPPILVLDEPTAGVDVELRHQLWDYVRKLNAAGVTVLLTTHYLKEAEELCDYIAIINHGDLIACESKAKLLRHLDAREITLTLGADLESVPASLSDLAPTLAEPRKLVFRYSPSRIHSGQIITSVQGAGLEIIDVSTREPELEDIFLNLTRRSAKKNP